MKGKLVPVILCGGAGTRLWPLSRKRFPKQFAPLPAGGVPGHESNLFRATVARARSLSPERMIVVCNEMHRFFVADNLRRNGMAADDVVTLVEPVSRNTAPAIALAAFEVVERGDSDDLILVLPSDHVVAEAEGFMQAVRTAAQAIEVARGGLLVTFGVVPECAETGYGYIRRGDPIEINEGGEIYRAAEFREKPDAETAKCWFEDGRHYWNSGMFAFTARTYLARLRALAPEIHAACAAAWEKRTRDFEFVCVEQASLETCPDVSVDYAVMEKADDVAVVPARLGWSDVGSWDALARLFERDGDGNAAVGDAALLDASDNVVYAGHRLVALLGVKDCIVAETPDAVLVAGRARSQDIKRLVGDLREREHVAAGEHSKVYRPWGSYERIDAAEGFQVKRLVVNPGQSLSLQLHRRRSEHWVVVRGTVRVTRGDEQFMLGVNQSTYIPAETKHRLENLRNEPAHLIEVQCGDYLGEDDIVRFEDDYGRTGKR